MRKLGILAVLLALQFWIIIACAPPQGENRMDNTDVYESRTVHVHTDDGRVLECQREGIVGDRYMIDCKELPQ